MKKRIISIILSVLAVPFAFSVLASAYTVTLYDNGVQYGSILTGDKIELPSEKNENGKTLYGWYDKTTGIQYGWKLVPAPTSESVELHSVWIPLEKARPAENAYKNGTFDDDGIYVRPSNGGTRIVTESDGNRALEYNRGSNYASLQIYVGWEAGRKYHVSYRVKTSGVTSVRYNPYYNNADHQKWMADTVKDEWITVEADFTIPDDYDASTENATNGFFSIYCNPVNGGPGTIYYDDLVLIPYARVHFNAGGGSGAPEDMFLLSGNVEIPDTVPVRRGFEFGGWSLTDGGSAPVTSVTVGGSDVELYAIWNPVEEQGVITYKYSAQRRGIADGSISIIAPDEAVDYTGVSILFADNSGIMDGYTPFATLSLNNGSALYTVSGSRIFAPGATRLSVRFTADGKDDIVYWCDIPEERRVSADEKPLFTFYAVSDIRLSDYWTEIPINRARMLNDIIANNPAFTIIAGDLVNNGVTAEYNRLDTYMKQNFNDPGRPAFIVNGNHEFHISDKNSTEYDRDALLNSIASQIAANREMGYTIRRDGDDFWYSAIIEGRKFIFMSTPSTPDKDTLASYVVSDEQLKFLAEELEDAEKTGYPAFVISHVPLKNYLPDSSDGITNTAAVEEILNRYPGTTVITAHTHSNLSIDNRLYVKTSGIGGMVFTHLNDGCAVWLEEGTSYGGYEVGFSAGQVIDVYSDKLVIKARKFADTNVYFGHGLFEAKLPGKDGAVPQVSIAGEAPADGVVLSAKLSGDGSDTPDEYRYEWLIDGKEVCSTPEYTIKADATMAGKYIVLRVSDADGNYTYARTEKPFTAIKIHYDANGGTGSVPTDTSAFAGQSYNPDAFGAAPQKEGYFFVGWSADPAAAVPMTSVVSDTDITLYAVYTDKPLFDFEATSCGWSPNAAVKTYEVKNSELHYTSDPGDMFFTLSGISFSADDNAYMRIKRRYDSGIGDGMFFSIKNGGGFSQNQRIPLKNAGTLVAELGDMQVMEYDIGSLVGDYWKGTVNSLRYDVIGGAGAGATDYIVFSNKHGIYKVNIDVASVPVIGKMPEDGSVSLSDDTTNCVLEEVSWTDSNPETGKFVLRAVVAPSDGFEFTTRRDILEGFKVNFGKIYDAEIDENSKAVIYAYVDAAVSEIGAGEKKALLAEFDLPIENAFVVIGYYSADGRLEKADVIRNVELENARLWIPADSGSSNIKVFVFDSESDLHPTQNPVPATEAVLP